jgi:Fic family protein
MMTFRERRLPDLTLPSRLIRLMIEIAESKGRQQLHERQAPRLLRALKTAAFNQSVDYSNRLDGIWVPPERLLPLVSWPATPLNQSENEVRGYAQALRRISVDPASFQVAPDLLLKLHGIVREGMDDAGRWRVEDSEVEQVAPNEGGGIWLEFVPARKIPVAVNELCESYNAALNCEDVYPLLTIGALVLDLLCIHPFREANGRISRLVGLLCLYQHGFEIGHFISWERVIKESQEEYVRAIMSACKGWSEGEHNVLPWLTYYLGTLWTAYSEFDRRMGEAMTAKGSLAILIEAAVDGLPGEFQVKEVERACPGVSHGIICRVLDQLKDKGRLEHLGLGRGKAKSAKSWRKKY